MITYKKMNGAKLAVYLQGRKIGEIVPEHAWDTDRGDCISFRYWPKGIRSVNAAGNLYETVGGVKRSLELAF